jgi:uncharacterized membrane protein YoaK (UPF0700 family)
MYREDILDYLRLFLVMILGAAIGTFIGMFAAITVWFSLMV